MAGVEIINVIQKVVDAMKSFMSKLAESSGRLIQTLETYSTAVGQKIMSQSSKIFNAVENSVKNEISALTTKLQSLASSLKKGGAPSDGNTILHKLGDLLKTAVSDIEKISKDFMEAFEKFISEFKKGIEKIYSTTTTYAKEGFSEAEGFAEKIVEKIVSAGKGALAGVKSMAAPIATEFKHVETFVFKHEIKVSEQNALSLVQPGAFLAGALSLGFLFLASKYEPS